MILRLFSSLLFLSGVMMSVVASSEGEYCVKQLSVFKEWSNENSK